MNGFENFFHGVDGLQKTDFLCKQLFWLWPFFNPYKKWPEPKNFLHKKSVFSILSTMQRNFSNPFILVLYFYNFWPELQMAAISPGDIFD